MKPIDTREAQLFTAIQARAEEAVARSRRIAAFESTTALQARLDRAVFTVLSTPFVLGTCGCVVQMLAR